MSCSHKSLISIPGKYHKKCDNCYKTILECSKCDAILEASPDVKDSGWIKNVIVNPHNVLTFYYCPQHS